MSNETGNPDFEDPFNKFIPVPPAETIKDRLKNEGVYGKDPVIDGALDQIIETLVAREETNAVGINIGFLGIVTQLGLKGASEDAISHIVGTVFNFFDAVIEDPAVAEAAKQFYKDAQQHVTAEMLIHGHPSFNN